MEKIDRLIDEEALTSWMCRSRNTTNLFRLNCPRDAAETALRAAVKSEILLRGRKPVMTRELQSTIDTVAAVLTSPPEGKFGLMFSGQCGNGKTTMARAVATAIRFFVLSGKYENPNLKVDAMTAKEIVTASGDDLPGIRRRNLLCIEDMGSEPTEKFDYGNISSPLVDLLEYRYDKMLFTMITTNLTPPQIAEKYGARLADRFSEMLEVIVFKDKSFRRQI